MAFSLRNRVLKTKNSCYPFRNNTILLFKTIDLNSPCFFNILSIEKKYYSKDKINHIGENQIINNETHIKHENNLKQENSRYESDFSSFTPSPTPTESNISNIASQTFSNSPSTSSSSNHLKNKRDEDEFNIVFGRFMKDSTKASEVMKTIVNIKSIKLSHLNNFLDILARKSKYNDDIASFFQDLVERMKLEDYYDRDTISTIMKYYNHRKEYSKVSQIYETLFLTKFSSHSITFEIAYQNFVSIARSKNVDETLTYFREHYQSYLNGYSKDTLPLEDRVTLEIVRLLFKENMSDLESEFLSNHPITDEKILYDYYGLKIRFVDKYASDFNKIMTEFRKYFGQPTPESVSVPSKSEYRNIDEISLALRLKVNPLEITRKNILNQLNSNDIQESITQENFKDHFISLTLIEFLIAVHTKSRMNILPESVINSIFKYYSHTLIKTIIREKLRRAELVFRSAIAYEMYEESNFFIRFLKESESTSRPSISIPTFILWLKKLSHDLDVIYNQILSLKKQSSLNQEGIEENVQSQPISNNIKKIIYTFLNELDLFNQDLSILLKKDYLSKFEQCINQMEKISSKLSNFELENVLNLKSELDRNILKLIEEAEKNSISFHKQNLFAHPKDRSTWKRKQHSEEI